MRTTKSQTITAVIAIAIAVIVFVGTVAVLYMQKDSETNGDQTVPKSGPSNETTQSDKSSVITKEKAEQIAIEKYGGTAISTESDDYKGTPAWEVEIRDSEQGRIEVKVDKKTGKILNVEKD